MTKVVIVSGGTGGHIFPGLAVANEFSSLGHDVSWIGSHRGMEQKLISPLFPFHAISAHQLRGKGLRSKLYFPLRLLRGIFQAVRVLHAIRPQCVVTFGGYVSGPGAIAAKFLRIPLIIHEQNARAGLTNRYLAKVATQTLQAFPHAFSKNIDATTVGNPVRRDILAIPEPQVRLANHQGNLRALVLGGSLGALALNNVIVEWMSDYEHVNSIQLKHQAGERHIKSVQEAYAARNIKVDVIAFIEDMTAALSWADVVICRAGALTVSEVAAVGLAAIFVPMPHAVDNHQYYNACYLADQSAAVIIEQKQLSVAALSHAINVFLSDRSNVLEMGKKARALSMRDATKTIVHSAINRFLLLDPVDTN